MKKKLLTVALCCMFSMLLVACGKSEGTEEPTVTPTVTPTEAPRVAPENDTYVQGKLTDTGFESEWMGIRFTAPEGVTMISQLELDAMNELAALTSSTVTEMQATWTDSIPVVQVMTEIVPYDGMKEEEYLYMLEYSLLQMEGGTYTTSEELYTFELGGQEFLCLSATVTDGGNAYVYQDYCAKEKDGRMILIIFTYIEGTEMDMANAIHAFSAY